MSTRIARQIMERIDALARISEEPGRLTRTFGSAAMRTANTQVTTWMKEAGMTVRQDAIGNIIGHYEGAHPHSKTLLLGSHLDTVRDAGRFDGPLGVILAIACVEHLQQQQIRLPYAIEIIGFCDEEGVRFQTTYLGSRAMAGTLTKDDLQRRDSNGTTLSEAIKAFGGDPQKLKTARLRDKNLLGYVEVHIEQGPVLENLHLPLAVVSAIAGQTRLKFTFVGHAGHAGTTPMNLRKDALCAAAEFVLALEKKARTRKGLVATVGQISARPGASNVISGEVMLTVDIRHQKNAVREQARIQITDVARKIALKRHLRVIEELIQQTASVPCDHSLSQLLSAALRKRQGKAMLLPSGAGHDAAIMARLTPAAMLFVRCKHGISHHPDESIKIQDALAAFHVMSDFLLLLANGHSRSSGA